MVCIICGDETRVTNSRPGKRDSSVWRRRECPGCLTVFSSREKPDLTLSIRVKSAAGSLEPFSEDKLFLSIYDCLSHRKTARADARELTSTVVGRLLPITSAIVTKQEIVDQALDIVKRFDKTAATIYKAHHPASS